MTQSYPTYPVIDLNATGNAILRRRLEMEISIPEMQTYFGFATVQAIYHWQSGRNLPSVDNFFALSLLLKTTINDLICVKAQ